MDLNHFSNKVSSQFGEDGILKKIFEILPAGNKYCVEFGAWDGKHFSNCCELVFNENWSGMMIEMDKNKFKELKHNYRDKPNITLLNKRVDFEGENSLENICSQNNAPKDFDLLSIDIDGNDYHVWESLKEYLPKVIVVEFNPLIPIDIEFVQERNMKVNQGSSILSLVSLGKSKGYELICATKCNAFFVKKEYFELFSISDNSVDKIVKSNYIAPRVFALFDGTIVLTDNLPVVWKQTTIKSYDLQMFPKFYRFFEDGQHSNIKLKVLNFLYRGYRKLFSYFRIE